jgi:aspartyl-tRNA(Asn)/glutamyl-tRNA(Gln) amidotransferase subunit A
VTDRPNALPIEELARRLRSRVLTAVEITEACLQSIEAQDKRLNAFIRVMADDARRQASECDRELAQGGDRGLLHGIPIAIKDLIDIEGVPTTAASRVREGHIATADAPVIRQLRDAGAVIIGKTNLDEFAFGTTNEHSAFGAVRNPHDPSRSPGGSSGGSAVAVATGMAPAALGTDTGGSVRIPAGACGVVGVKPTYGEVRVDGVVPLSRSLDHIGVFARSVAGAWAIYRALAPQGERAPSRAASIEGLQLGVPSAYFCDLLDDEVRLRFDEAVALLQRAGARVDAVDIPHSALTPAVYVHIHSTEAFEYHARMLDETGHRYTASVRRRLETGRYVLAADYVRAQKAREHLRHEVDAALGLRDALVLPGLPIPAPPIGVESVSIAGSDQPVRAMMLRCTQLFNLTGHPAVSLPCGSTSQHLPCGLQLVGRRHETEALMSVALAVERVLAGSNVVSGFSRTLT